MLQEQLSEMQAKYAQKMADQLSKIAALQEENDIKDIQLEQLRESMENQSSKRNAEEHRGQSDEKVSLKTSIRANTNKKAHRTFESDELLEFG